MHLRIAYATLSSWVECPLLLPRYLAIGRKYFDKNLDAKWRIADATSLHQQSADWRDVMFLNLFGGLPCAQLH